jgi:hypothetical protein
MKTAFIIALIIVGLIVGGVLYVRQKIAEALGGATFDKGNVKDLSRSVALPMMDDQWLGERKRPEAPPRSTT